MQDGASTGRIELIQPMPQSPQTSSTFKTVCSHDCPDACSVLVAVENGKAARFRGDPDHPVTRGFLCGKVSHYEDVVYSPHRLLCPLRRKGKKGGGHFEKIAQMASFLPLLDLVG